MLKQLAVENVNKIKAPTVNKYLEYFSRLFTWAKKNNYIPLDPFNDMNIPDTEENKREALDDEELSLIFSELDKGKNGLAKTDLRYWSTLIFLYTGARRNEIASLTPDDLLQDESTKIWYFKIKDEKKSKREKKDMYRYVPVHSELIKRGLIKYRNKVLDMREKAIKANAKKGQDLRLLHELTHTEKHGWGKKLTYWFSNILLKKLDIKRDELSLHSTRHTFITYMKTTDTEYAVIDCLVGHQGNKNVGEKVYTHYSLKHLKKFKECIDKLSYV